MRKASANRFCALSVDSIFLAFGSASTAAWRSSGILMFLPLP
jgi:hypothetical protein